MPVDGFIHEGESCIKRHNDVGQSRFLWVEAAANQARQPAVERIETEVKGMQHAGIAAAADQLGEAGRQQAHGAIVGFHIQGVEEKIKGATGLRDPHEDNIIHEQWQPEDAVVQPEGCDQGGEQQQDRLPVILA